MSYDEKFRRHVLKTKEKEGLSFAKVAKRFGIAKQTVYYWTKRLLEKKKRNREPLKLCLEALKRDVEIYPDAYQYERGERLGVSQNCIWRGLKRLGITYKKTLKHPKACSEKRSAFCQKISKHKVNGRNIVFLDESGFSHDMPRTHGYSLKGARCFGIHDWGAKGRTNVIGALLGSVLLTVSLFETTVNTAVFNAWVIQDLIPKLPKKSVVVMDNATFHKGQDMVNALKTAGHTLLYLPPYSPDLNPIEHKWAQVKALRRKIGGSVEELFNSKRCIKFIKI